MRYCALFFALIWSIACAASPQERPPVVSSELTLAEELMKIERNRGNASTEAEQLLIQILGDMVASLGSNPKQPQTASEAVKVSEIWAAAMAKHNLLQPEAYPDWPDSLGVAFKPLSLDEDNLNYLLTYSGNRQRARFYDLSQPMRFVDCDMGALLIFSAAQKMGWDVRVVTIPNHAFLRWHLPSGERVNWDWTKWASIEDSSYMSNTGLNADLILRRAYMHSLSLDATRGHYIGLLASELNEFSDKLKYGEEAIKSDIYTPLTQNNFAWDLAIKPDTTHTEAQRAVFFALAGWSADIKNGNRTDTVACALARIGETELALAMEDYAIRNVRFPSQAEGFRNNRKRIAMGEICE